MNKLTKLLHNFENYVATLFDDLLEIFNDSRESKNFLRLRQHFSTILLLVIKYENNVTTSLCSKKNNYVAIM